MWPTWSPDGRRLAYARYELESGAVRRATIYVTAPDGSQQFAVHRSDGLPVYFNWAPNGERLAVLVQRRGSLELEIAALEGAAAPWVVARGAPLYFAWSPDSGSLLASIGGAGSGSAEGRLVWINADDGATSPPAPQIVSHLPLTGFRVPSWAPRLGGMTVGVDQGGTQVIGLVEGAEFRYLCPCGLAPALSWSPDGQNLAITARATEDGPYEGLFIYHAPGGAVERASEVSPLAFFWCDDHRIVCITGPIGDRVVGIRVIDIVAGTESDHGHIRPSRDLLQLFGHFDQYATSARIVSPAGDALLLAASRAQEQENGSVPTVRQILIRPLDPSEADQVVGRGRIAVWKPLS